MRYIPTVRWTGHPNGLAPTSRMSHREGARTVRWPGAMIKVKERPRSVTLYFLRAVIKPHAGAAVLQRELWSRTIITCTVVGAPGGRTADGIAVSPEEEEEDEDEDECDADDYGDDYLNGGP